MRKHVDGEEQWTPNKKPRFPIPDGFSSRPPHPPPSRRIPNFRSDFAFSHATSSHSGPSKQNHKSKARPLPVVDLGRRQDVPLRLGAAQDVLVPKENLFVVGSSRVLSPRPPLLPVLHSSSSTKILNPPRLSSPPLRPSTPPKNLSAPDISKFLSPSNGPSRPSKPVSRTRIALATDLWTDGGRADLLGLTLEQDGTQYATPMEKAVRRGLEVSPRKSGIGKEIRYARGGLAEQASRVVGKKMTADSLWRKSTPSPESASMFVEIEEILYAPKPPPRRGAAGMLLCLARCRLREERGSVLVLFSVPPYDAKSLAMTVGGRVGIYEPLVGEVHLCSRFVEI